MCVDNVPLIAEDGPEAITEALVAVGVTGSPLDLEPAMTKFSLKFLTVNISSSAFKLGSVFRLNDMHCDTCVQNTPRTNLISS